MPQKRPSDEANFADRINAIRSAFEQSDQATKNAIKIAGSYDIRSIENEEFDDYDPGWSDFSQWSQSW